MNKRQLRAINNKPNGCIFKGAAAAGAAFTATARTRLADSVTRIFRVPQKRFSEAE